MSSFLDNYIDFLLAYMLLCDDTERDYGDLEVAAAFKKKCDDNGFITISEKDEFETLYPDGAHK